MKVILSLMVLLLGMASTITFAENDGATCEKFFNQVGGKELTGSTTIFNQDGQVIGTGSILAKFSSRRGTDRLFDIDVIREQPGEGGFVMLKAECVEHDPYDPGARAGIAFARLLESGVADYDNSENEFTSIIMSRRYRMIESPEEDYYRFYIFDLKNQ